MDDDRPVLDRRSFLEATAVAGLVGAAGAGAAGCGGAQLVMPRYEADRLVARLEGGLHAVRSAPPVVGIPDTPENRRLSRLVKVGMEGLIVADVARAIPRDGRVDDRLRDAVGRELPVLDRCAATYATLLAGAPREARRGFDRRLRYEPDLVMRFAEEMDEAARERHEIQPESRLKLRQVASTVSRRVKRQSTSAVIDDAVGKVERIVARQGGSVSFAREAASRAVLASIWQSVEPTGPSGGGGAVPPPPAADRSRRVGRLVPGPVQTDATAPSGPTGELSFEYDTGQTELIAGGVMLGAGPAAFGIAVGIGAATGSSDGVMWGAIIGATPGVVLLVLGMVFLAIGATRSGTPQ